MTSTAEHERGPAAPPRADTESAAYPPETLEGWYALHQIYSFDRAAVRALGDGERAEQREGMVRALHELAEPEGERQGWSAVVPLIGSVADVMFMHFRPDLDALGAAQRRLAREPLFDVMRPVTSFLSVTEAGLYHVTARLAREAAVRGGSVGDEAYRAAMAARVEAEQGSAHVRRRLYPQPPAEMPYVCFYPMSKRRAPGQNWYALSLDERSRLMHAHGLTGRRYAGRVMQVITGAIGFDAWEWGVTLFAADPLAFKKLVTDMRFDEASAEYAEFGEFYVGKIADPAAWAATV